MNFDDYTTIRNCTFAFKCEMKWANLDETEDDEIRFCRSCQSEVHFCETDEKLVKAIKRNKCVAITSPYNSQTEVGMIDVD